jgi:glutathione peroxidase
MRREAAPITAGSLVGLALILGLAVALGAGCARQSAARVVDDPTGPVIDHTVTTIDGREVALSEYRGKAMLIVNTASRCGLTPQYAGLQTLYDRYRERGLVVLGFPCNDFMGQEPGSEAEIAAFCENEYGVTFPMFAKVRVKGEKDPLYRTLTEEIAEPLRGEIEWNFAKFLVDPDGRVVARFSPRTEPLADEVVAAIESVLPR